MCKQSANTQTVVQNPTIPDWLSNQFQSLATRAQGVSDRPYNPAVQKNVADFTPDQLQSFQQVRQDQGIYQPYMNAATGYAQIGGSTINGNQIANYSNPYQQQVIDATMANIQSNNATQQANLRGNAALQGGLGNDRLKIAQAELAKNQNLATNQTLATLNAQNYNQALGAAQQDRSAAQTAATQFGNLGQNMQALAGRDSAALALQGATQQALAQQQLDTTSANIAQQEQYPFATASWLGGMLQGASPSFTGSQSTTTSPGPSALSQIAGLGMLGYGMFGLSDERLKENIEPIGEDNAGRTIYRFNFKGNPKTEIGYLAQEVAQTDPDAVTQGEDGYLYVDYKDVTDDAVQPEREEFNSGGYAVPGTYTVDKNNIIRMSGGNQPAGQGTPYGSSNIVPQAAATQMAALFQPKKMEPPKSRAKEMYDDASDIAGDMRGMQKAGQGLASMADQGMRGLGGVSMKPFSSYGPPAPEGLANGGRVGYYVGGLAAPGSFRGAQQAGMPTPYGASNIVPQAPQPQMQPPQGLGMGAAPGSFRAAQEAPGVPTGPAEGSFRAAQQEGMPSDDGQTISGAQGSNGLTGSAGLGGLFGPMSDPARQGVIQAGLGMLAGTSPHAMVNIGRGGQVGYAAYQQAVAAEQRKAQEALQNRIAEEKLRMMTEEFKQRQLEFQENAPLRQAQIAEAQRRASEPGFERRQEIEREQAIKRVEAEREIKKREAIEAGYGPDTPEYKAHVFGIQPRAGDKPMILPEGGTLIDPRTGQVLAQGKPKPRNISIGDIGKLAEEGKQAADAMRFGATFKDEYAGYGATWAGDAAMALGRAGISGPTTKAAAGWWNDYDRYKNAVRNQLFGSALTSTEREAFEKSDITTGMDPEQVRKNLARQKEIALLGLRTKAQTMIKSGYDPEVIASAYGLTPEQVMEPVPTLEERERMAAEAAKKKDAAGKPKVDTAKRDQLLKEANDAISKGAPRDAVMKRLKEQHGIEVE